MDEQKWNLEKPSSFHDKKFLSLLYNVDYRDGRFLTH